MLAVPVAADGCSGYRAAFVLYEAAERSISEHPVKFDPSTLRIIDQPGPEHLKASDCTFRALDHTARAVRRTVAPDHNPRQSRFMQLPRRETRCSRRYIGLFAAEIDS